MQEIAERHTGSVSAWQKRQQRIEETWKEHRPQIFATFVASQHIDTSKCFFCEEKSCVRCSSCKLDLCPGHDEMLHLHNALHDRKSLITHSLLPLQPEDIYTYEDDIVQMHQCMNACFKIHVLLNKSLSARYPANFVKTCVCGKIMEPRPNETCAVITLSGIS